MVISGGNIDVNLIDRIIAQGLAKTGRIFRIAVDLRGLPGALATLSRVIAAKGANILHIRHDRISKGIPVGCSRVVLELETTGCDHIQEILETLREEEYVVGQTRGYRDLLYHNGPRDICPIAERASSPWFTARSDQPLKG